MQRLYRKDMQLSWVHPRDHPGMFMLYHACSYPENIGEAIDPNLIMTDSVTTSRLVKLASCVVIV